MLIKQFFVFIAISVIITVKNDSVIVEL